MKGGAICFFGVKIFFSTTATRHYFFSTKTSFLRHKVLSEYFFLPRDRTFCSSSLLIEPKKTMPPPFKLNGCSLSIFGKGLSITQVKMCIEYSDYIHFCPASSKISWSILPHKYDRLKCLPNRCEHLIFQLFSNVREQCKYPWAHIWWVLVYLHVWR